MVVWGEGGPRGPSHHGTAQGAPSSTGPPTAQERAPRAPQRTGGRRAAGGGGGEEPLPGGQPGEWGQQPYPRLSAWEASPRPGPGGGPCTGGPGARSAVHWHLPGPRAQAGRSGPETGAGRAAGDTATWRRECGASCRSRSRSVPELEPESGRRRIPYMRRWKARCGRTADPAGGAPASQPGPQRPRVKRRDQIEGPAAQRNLGPVIQEAPTGPGAEPTALQPRKAFLQDPACLGRPCSATASCRPRAGIRVLVCNVGTVAPGGSVCVARLAWLSC